MSDETYNGWKNYPTWAVNLWLSNDEGLSDTTQEITRAAMESDPAHPRYAVKDSIKSLVTEDLVPEVEGMTGDLLGYALDCVDWYEVADAWIEQVSEVEA